MLFSFQVIIGLVASLLLFVSKISGASVTSSTVKVNAEHATLTGAVDPTLPIDTFYDIPYAQPPVGKLRLQPPQLILKNLGHLDVSKKTSSHCYGIVADPSLGFMLQDGTEDCLKLDIVRPHTLSKGVLLPVFVFIHGYASRHS
jgi:carboxylesterase type B